MLPKPNRTYSSDDLASFRASSRRALKEKIDGAAISDEELQDLGSHLAKVIMDRFTAGETDPEALKQAAVERVGAR
jgi:hypothetical protein